MPLRRRNPIPISVLEQFREPSEWNDHFPFQQIEGSARLWENYPEAMRVVSHGMTRYS